MRLAFDGAHRRRIHLFRHGDVSYVDDAGNRVPDSRAVPLTDWGREQARLMAEFLKDIEIDRAVCSGLPRTIQTAEGILEGRTLPVETHANFEEIRSDQSRYQRLASLDEVAYAFAQAHEPGARYGDGEAFADFEARVLSGLNELLHDTSWKSLALIAHGGVNRVILGWACGAGLKAFQAFEQNTGCLNVIDVDVHSENGATVRTLIRGVNITPYDPAKKDVHLTALETLAERMKPKFRAPADG